MDGLAALHILALDNNQLDGSIPASLGSLTTLSALSLSNNMLNGFIPASLGSLTTLSALSLSNNQLVGTIPFSFGSLTALQTLSLDNNYLSGYLPSSMDALTAMQALFLARNDFCGADPIPFNNYEPSDGALPPCTFTCCSGQPSCGGLYNNLAVCSALGDLYRATNGDGWADNSGWSAAAAATPTNYCDFANTDCTGSGALTQLALDSMQMSGTIPLSLGDVSTLLSLRMSSNRIRGALPNSLSMLTALTTLSLYDNELSGTIPSSLGSMTALTLLGLSVNQLSGTLPPSLGSLAALKIIALSQNQLSGTIPPSLGSLTALQVLALALNQLSGTLPPSLGSLIALTSLVLFQNQLSGTIPLEMGSLTALEVLYLANSGLCGANPIPFNPNPPFTYFDFDGLPDCASPPLPSPEPSAPPAPPEPSAPPLPPNPPLYPPAPSTTQPPPSPNPPPRAAWRWVVVADFNISLPTNTWLAKYHSAVENTLRAHVLRVTGKEVMPYVYAVSPSWWIPSPRYNVYVQINVPSSADAKSVAAALASHPINFAGGGLPQASSYRVSLAHQPSMGDIVSDTFILNSESSSSSTVPVLLPDGSLVYENVTGANFTNAAFASTDVVVLAPGKPVLVKVGR